MVRHTFVTWCVVTALLCTGLFWAWREGVVALAIEADHVHLIAVTAAAFAIVWAYLGKLSWLLDQWDGAVQSATQYVPPEWFTRRLSWGWFMGNWIFSIGILGTATGMLLMLGSAFTGNDLSKGVIQAEMIPTIGKYYSMALYATCLGLTGGMIVSKFTQFLTFALDVRTWEE